MTKILALFGILILPTLMQAQKISTDFKQLQALIGTWTMNRKNAVLYEVWHFENDSTLKGKSYMLKPNKDSMLLETTTIQQKGNSIFFTAVAANQNDGSAVDFKLKSSKAKIFVFENHEHDFPTRVVYQLVSKNALNAWIEGKVEGKFKKSNYSYVRKE